MSRWMIPLRVGVGQRVRDLAGDAHGILGRQTALAVQPVAQVLAFDIRHDEIGDRRGSADLDDTGIEDRKDVGMLQTRGELDLTKETLETQGTRRGPAGRP